MDTFRKDVGEAKTVSGLEKVVHSAVGESGFMFARSDHGEVVHKGKQAHMPGIMRLVIGNPLIMREMVEQVPDAGSYAPVTILIDERPNGINFSYDRMASFIGPYRNAEALLKILIRNSRRYLT